jgi:hypothetical protein
MMMEFTKPIPVIFEDGKEGYALYAESSGILENDVWTCVVCDGGQVRHFTTNQLRIYANATFGITKRKNDGQ